MYHAIVDKTNTVVNIIVWKGAEWLPPRNHLVVNFDREQRVGIGDKYDMATNTFSKSPAQSVAIEEQKS